VTRAFLSLGTNEGDRAVHLTEGVRLVSAGDAYRLSRVYETEPVGGIPQDDFWNLVVELDTSASAHELLVRAREAETARGRVRAERWGPRTLDVDVLYLDGFTSDVPELTVPHPRLYERAFVMAPLRELAPDLVSEEQLGEGVGRVLVLGTLESLR
jgi:2-amino-4-hydroxy-6-hydroxymethyldihydropteridine diphosphokinase